MHTSTEDATMKSIRDGAAARYQHPSGDSLPTGTQPNPSVYSSQLHDLVKECLKLNPAQRPGFLDLRRRTFEEGVRMELAFGDVWNNATLAPHLRLKYKRDKFRTGTRLPTPETGAPDEHDDGDDDRPQKRRKMADKR